MSLYHFVIEDCSDTYNLLIRCYQPDEDGMEYARKWYVDVVDDLSDSVNIHYAGQIFDDNGVVFSDY